MSFGKKDDYRARGDTFGGKKDGLHEMLFEDEANYLNIGGGFAVEFSDESLFGEDPIEDMINKKSSFAHGGTQHDMRT